MPSLQKGYGKAMSKKDRHDWLKEVLAKTGSVVVGDNKLIDQFVELFPEAEKSRRYYVYGVHPCSMLRNDCRELYKRGEFGERRIIGNGFGAGSLGLGNHGVGYVLFQCYICKTNTKNSNSLYRYGVVQLCKKCFEELNGKPVE